MIRHRIISKLLPLFAGALLLAACAQSPEVAPVADVPPPASAPAPGTPPPSTTPPVPTACADPRPQTCTMDYRPVCATRDTGVRCITTPCPSTEQKTFSNACSACSDPKVIRHVPGECPVG
jgi:hypothetical protein